MLRGTVRTEEAAFEALAELGVELLGVFVIADGEVEWSWRIVNEKENRSGNIEVCFVFSKVEYRITQFIPLWR